MDSTRSDTTEEREPTVEMGLERVRGALEREEGLRDDFVWRRVATALKRYSICNWGRMKSS